MTTDTKTVRKKGLGLVEAFHTDFSVVARIIHYLKLTFVADRPPPPRLAYKEVLMAAAAKEKEILER